MLGQYCCWALASLVVLTFFDSIVEGQRFTAARKSASLKRRDASFIPSYGEQMLTYADESCSSATLRLEPKLPLLVLEDIEEYFKTISCTDRIMSFSFHDSDTFNAIALAWSTDPFFAVVTSHDGCQMVDEHEARIIHRIDFDYHRNTIKLTGERSSLREVTHRIVVDIDKHSSSDRHIRLARQEQATSTIIATGSQTATTTFSYQSPTASATGASLSADVSFSRLNTTLIPPDSSIVQYIPTPSGLDNIKLSCKNCTMTGNIELIAGGFSINSSSLDALMDFFDDGYLEFDATGISAYMDFELAFLPGFKTFEFVAQLPSIPLGAIEIAGLLEFGPVLDLTFPTSVDLNSPVTFNTGFTLTAPPLAKIYLNMSEPDSSYTTGFSESKLEALPFTANAQNLSFNLSTGFKPLLLLGAGAGSNAFDASVAGGIGVYLDLPKLSTTLDMLNNVNEKCESTTTNAQNGLIRVAPSVTYEGGAQWNFDADIFGLAYENGQAKDLLSNTTTLPTQCLAWDTKASSLVAATSLSSSTSTSSSGQGGTSTGSAKNEGQATKLDFLVLTAACFIAALGTSGLI